MDTSKNTDINIADETEPPPDPGGGLKTSELEKRTIDLVKELAKNSNGNGNGSRRIVYCERCNKKTSHINHGAYFERKGNKIIYIEIYRCACSSILFKRTKNGKYKIH